MTTPNDTSPDWSLWGGFVALCGFLLTYFKANIKPRQWLAWINEPTMRPVHARLDQMDEKWDSKWEHVCRVIDKLPGSTEAHAAVRAEDEKERYNWSDP